MSKLKDIDINEDDYRITSRPSADIRLSADEIDSVRLRGVACTIIWDPIGSNWNIVPNRYQGKPRRMSFETLLNALPRLLSAAAFLCLIVDQCE